MKKKKKKNNKNISHNKKISNKIKKVELSEEEKIKMRKKFIIGFCVWIAIFAVGLVIKTFQNDTFYTIKIGELILNNGIDMMDHFSFHTGMAYTYPHWLYDVFIYLVYAGFGYIGLYFSTIILLIILLFMVFKTNIRVSKSVLVSVFATFICALSISGFATARAQLVSFILFALEIFCIESFLETKKKKYAFGLLLVSLALCNVHVAVWPFYFILYLPYIAEFIISFICGKIKLKKENKFTRFLKKKFVTEQNKNIKYLMIIMVTSLLTGLLTPIGDTPYTYLIKTMMGNSQDYIQEHQMITWAGSPFTIIIAGETLFLALISKVKLRDLFMICGLVLMSIFSTRHLSLLSLIGTICFARLFAMFLQNYQFDVDNTLLKHFMKKRVYIWCFVGALIFSSITTYFQCSKEFIDSEFYPVEAVKYIKENVDIDNMRIFNDYNFGSYLLYNDIPVFIDSRADLYTKQFSGFEYDVFDDYMHMSTSYSSKFEFYDITHVLIYKERDDNLYNRLSKDENYKMLYEDEDFVFYEKIGTPDVIFTYDN